MGTIGSKSAAPGGRVGADRRRLVTHDVASLDTGCDARDLCRDYLIGSLVANLHLVNVPGSIDEEI